MIFNLAVLDYLDLLYLYMYIYIYIYIYYIYIYICLRKITQIVINNLFLP